MDRIILFGGGPHAQCCIDTIQKQGLYEIVGIADPYHDINEVLYGYPVIGRQENIKELVEMYGITGGVISIGDNWIRKYVSEFVRSQIPEFTFVNAIHPNTVIGCNVELGVGFVTMAGCIINPGCKIGDFCLMVTGAQIEHDSIMSDYSSISVGSITGGNVTIGRYSAITIGATVLEQIQIGENSVIGAGSLVLKDVPDNVLVYGNPARIIRSREIGERFLKPGLRFK